MPRTAVLFSGGLDSAVLLARELEGHEAQRGTQPIHIRAGLAWEDAEARAIERLLEKPPFAGRVAPIITITSDMRDVYPPTHWAINGKPPAYDTPDEDVYLIGRNVVLLAKAGVLAATRRAHRIALGPLAGNPFPDARPIFFDEMARALSIGLAHDIEVATPFLRWKKQDVIRRGVELGVPLELTLSCMNPVPGNGGPPVHCGQCSKCRERRDAFAVLGVTDRARYAAASPR